MVTACKQVEDFWKRGGAEMTPEPRTRPRTRRRKLETPAAVEAVETTAAAEEPLSAAQPPEPDPTIAEMAADASPDAEPTIIETTATVLSEEVEPLVLEPEPEGQRTDFFFPPLPRSDQQTRSQTTATSRARQRARPARRRLRRLLKGLARTIPILAVFVATSFKRATFPALRGIWRWIVVDPYAPPREQPERAILQGHVLGVYRYQLYQRVILGLLGGIPLTIAACYLLYIVINSLLYGVEEWLFLAQDLAGAFAGVFSGLMMLSLAKTRITLRGDGIEYKTMFRVVRSRWEEISMLKVDYFRHSERWVVGTGRGAWAFLVRSLFGLPKGRQLAKLITIYARLRSTGTPYWLPSLGRFSESSPAAERASRKTEAPAGAQQQAP
jgi:hypothetical protein